MRPIIGISMYRQSASWGQWEDRPATLLPASYANAVTAGGATPVLLPPYGIADDIIGVVRRLDGLIIAGGADINPSRYGRQPWPRATYWHDDRDISELALLGIAEDLDMPTLGICRGMQLMAVHTGGALIEVEDVVEHGQLHYSGPGRYVDNRVRTVAGSRTAAILGPEAIGPCHHRQAVESHPQFVATAYTDDNLIEAMERTDRRFWMGVQWHPESGTDPRLFEAIATAAAGYHQARIGSAAESVNASGS